MNMDLAFVICGAAGVNVAVADGWLEGGSRPEMEGFSGLNVVMAVKKDGGLARSFERFGVDERVKSRGNDINGLETAGAKIVGDPAGGALNIGLMLGFCANAWDAKEFVKFRQMQVATRIDEFGQVHGDG